MKKSIVSLIFFLTFFIYSPLVIPNVKKACYYSTDSYKVSFSEEIPNNNKKSKKLEYPSILLAETEAKFTADPTEGPFPLAVAFINNSTNATEYSWNFGDGETSSEVSPIHTYIEAGDFTVSLVASNNDVSDTITKSYFITVTWPAPVANFVAAPTSGTSPLTVFFSDESENAYTWLWEFGDGSFSTNQNPSHIFTTGIYSVSLLITNPSGNAKVTMQNLVKSGITGINEVLKNDLKVFPNPVKDILIIELLNKNYKVVEFELFDMFGKTLKKEKPKLAELIKCDIQMPDLEAGIYILRVTVDNDFVVRSIVKN